MARRLKSRTVWKGGDVTQANQIGLLGIAKSVLGPARRHARAACVTYGPTEDSRARIDLSATMEAMVSLRRAQMSQ